MTSRRRGPGLKYRSSVPKVLDQKNRWGQQGAWWRSVERGHEWRLLTSLNVTSWGSGAIYVSRVQAPIMMIQEHKLGRAKMEEVKSSFSKQGMKWFGSAALQTAAQGWSAGVAILAQGFLDIWEPCKEAELFPGRCSMVFVRLPAIGVIALYVIYMQCDVGLAGDNITLLERLAIHVAGHKVPWAAVGDFNVPPEVLAAAEWVQRLRARLIVTAEATCHNSAGGHTRLDYMLASQDLALALGEPQINGEVTMATHEGVDFMVKRKVDWPQVRILADTPTLPTVKPRGPVRPGPHWEQLCRTFEEAGKRCSGKSKTHWKDAVTAIRQKLGQHVAEEVEERCGTGKGVLQHWAHAPATKLVGLDEVWAKPRRREAKPSTFIQKAAGTLLNAAGAALQIHTCCQSGCGQTTEFRSTLTKAEERLNQEASIMERMIRAKVLTNSLVSDDQAKSWRDQLETWAKRCRHVAEAAIVIAGMPVAAAASGERHSALARGPGRLPHGTDSKRRRDTEWESLSKTRPPHQSIPDGGPLAAMAAEFYVGAWALGNMAKRWVPRLLVQEGRKTSEGCRQWAKEMLLNGASRAHAWIKPPESWTPDIVGEEQETPEAERSSDTRMLTGPVEALAQQRSIWKGWWAAEDKQDAEADTRLMAKLDHLVERQEQGSQRWVPPEECRGTKHQIEEAVKEAQALHQARAVGQAAHNFKQRTTRVGGIHPRHLGWADHEIGGWAHQAVAIYFDCVEEAGTFGEADEIVFIQLLRKAAGGRRPIAFFTSLYRLWGKTRKRALLKWESLMLMDEMYNTGKGKKTTDSIWRAEVRAEASKGIGKLYAMIMWDLLKAYDTIDHDLLATEAYEQQFPMKIMRLMIRAYRWKRVLMLDGLLAEDLWPQKSIGAGCWGALAALKTFMARTFRKQVRQYTWMVLTIHVDDLLMEVEADEEADILDKLELGTNHMHFRIRQLRMQMALDKAACAASTTELQEAVQRRLGKRAGGCTEKGTKCLGVDVRAGRTLWTAARRTLKRKRPHPPNGGGIGGYVSPRLAAPAVGLSWPWESTGEE